MNLGRPRRVLAECDRPFVGETGPSHTSQNHERRERECGGDQGPAGAR
jgi:hypothetical protein